MEEMRHTKQDFFATSVTGIV